MKTTKEQDCIIDAVSNYRMTLNEWNELIKDMLKPVWVGEGAEEEIRNKHIYLEKHEAVMNAVCYALNVSLDEAEKLTDEWEKYCQDEYEKPSEER